MDRKAVLEMLVVYQEDLARGVYPAMLSAYFEADDGLNAILDSCMRLEEDFGSVLKEEIPDLASDFRRAMTNARRSRNTNFPEYYIAQFAQERLILKSSLGRDLTPDEVEQNRRRLQDYREQLESLDDQFK